MDSVKKSLPIPAPEVSQGTEIIAFYFARSNCPASRSFTPVLADFYAVNHMRYTQQEKFCGRLIAVMNDFQTLKERQAAFEVVYVPLDARVEDDWILKDGHVDWHIMSHGVEGIQ